ncbi:MAG: polymer-forming cytoskeletal protein [Chloroflexi bacterium]|nr:polymer-forming cytoskeletal protein [Chloroflexota bacterium]
MKTETGKRGVAKMRLRLVGLIGLCLIVLLGVATPSVYAADFRSGTRVVIGSDQVINDDLYVTADEIIIDGTIKGDVYAFGGTVTINGTVDRDVIAGAQTVIVNGAVGDTARVGGQAVVFGDKANIARSALVGAFSLETKPSSVVGGDLLFGAYQALLAGTVQHDVIASANGIQISGTVGRNVRVSVGSDSNAGPSPTTFMPASTVAVPSVPTGLTIAPTAKIGGDLIYESQRPVQVPEGAKVSGPVVQQTPVPETEGKSTALTPEQVQQQQTQQTVEYFLDALRRFIVLLLVGLLVLWLLPKWIQRMAEFIQAKPLGSFGRGILVVLGYFVALILLVIVVVILAIVFGILTLSALSWASLFIGSVLFGVLAVGYYVFVSYIAPIVVSYFGGRWLLERVQPQWAQNRYIAFSVGLILLSLVSLIPVISWIVGLLVALFALGALYLWAAPMLQRKGATAVQTV